MDLILGDKIFNNPAKNFNVIFRLATEYRSLSDRVASPGLFRSVKLFELSYLS